MTRRPPSPPLFPYTTLFRSRIGWGPARHMPRTRSHARRIPLAISPTRRDRRPTPRPVRSEEHTSELQSHSDLVCRLLLEKKKTTHIQPPSPATSIPGALIKQ